MLYANKLTFMQPRRVVDPSPWIGHIPFAFWLMDAAQPKSVVELGTHTGNSFCAFLQASEALQLDCHIYAVDHWQGDEHSGLYADDIFNSLNAYVKSVYPGRGTMVRSSFDDAISRFADSSIDILHIDGMHTYEAVRHDFETWLPKLTKDGLVLFHDTSVTARNFGVGRFFREVSARHKAIQLTHSHGLGVLCLGTPPKSVAALLNGDSDEAGLSPQPVFERMGNAVLDQFIASKFSGLNDPASTLGSIRARANALQHDLGAALNSLQLDQIINSAFRSQYTETGLGVDLLIASILQTEFFSPHYYQKQIGTPLLADRDLCRDYLTRGERAGLTPSEYFSPRDYRASNPDVAASIYGMLEHFILFGRAEGRSPLPIAG